MCSPRDRKLSYVHVYTGCGQCNSSRFPNVISVEKQSSHTTTLDTDSQRAHRRCFPQGRDNTHDHLDAQPRLSQTYSYTHDKYFGIMHES